MSRTALLIVDVQQGLDDPKLGKRNNPSAEANMARLLAAWRARNKPVIHIQHSSTRPSSPLWAEKPGFAFKKEVTPQEGEKVFVKRVNSAFVGTDLENYLREKDIGALVVMGLTTDHCVSATTRTASDLGFEVEVVSDATATHERTDPEGHAFGAEDIHRVHLASLHGEFCTVVTTDAVLAGLEPVL